MQSGYQNLPIHILNIQTKFHISDHYNISYTTTLRNTIRKETEAIHKIDLGRKRKIMFDGLMI